MFGFRRGENLLWSVRYVDLESESEQEAACIKRQIFVESFVYESLKSPATKSVKETRTVKLIEEKEDAVKRRVIYRDPEPGKPENKRKVQSTREEPPRVCKRKRILPPAECKTVSKSPAVSPETSVASSPRPDIPLPLPTSQLPREDLVTEIEILISPYDSLEFVDEKEEEREEDPEEFEARTEVESPVNGDNIGAEDWAKQDNEDWDKIWKSRKRKAVVIDLFADYSEEESEEEDEIQILN